MRVFAIAATALALLAAPARADHFAGTEVVFDGATPCAVACSYWVDAGYLPCENPFPPGSWVDHVTAPAPTPPQGKIVILEGELDMLIDWDAWFCEDSPEQTEMATLWLCCGQPCDNLLGSNNLVPVGCEEFGSTSVRAGQTVIFRAYNWLDPGPAHGWYRFVSV